MGRPCIIETPEEFAAEAESYFLACDEAGEPYTVPGLCLALGFNHRNVLHEYGKKANFRGTVSRARQVIEDQRAKMLVDGKLKNTSGVQFDLKNNFDYRDRQDLHHDGDVGLKVIQLPPKKQPGEDTGSESS